MEVVKMLFTCHREGIKKPAHLVTLAKTPFTLLLPMCPVPVNSECILTVTTLALQEGGAVNSVHHNNILIPAKDGDKKIDLKLKN